MSRFKYLIQRILGRTPVVLIVLAASPPGSAQITSMYSDESGVARGAARPAISTTTAAADTIDRQRLIAAGLEVYLKQYCGVCHRLDVAETTGPFGPPQDEVGTIAAQRIRDPSYAGQATTAEEYIRESIVDPATYLVPGYPGGRYRMPAYTSLSEADLDALVQMLLDQRSKQ